VEADIYAPCALGGVINPATVDAIKAKAVAGAANNQLASPEMGQRLHERGILFAPDYVINAGGVVSGLEEMYRALGKVPADLPPLNERLERIFDRLLQIFARASREGTTPEATTERLARELIGR
jgi:leucine dehydrogenase